MRILSLLQLLLAYRTVDGSHRFWVSSRHFHVQGQAHAHTHTHVHARDPTHLLASSRTVSHLGSTPQQHQHRGGSTRLSKEGAGGGPGSPESPAEAAEVAPTGTGLLEQAIGPEGSAGSAASAASERTESTENTESSHAESDQPSVDASSSAESDQSSVRYAWLPKIFHRKDKNYKTYAKKLKNRNATNLRRKVMHCSWGLLFAAMNHFIPPRFFVTGMTVLSSGTLLMELLRYRPGFQWMNDALHGVLGSSLRKHEMEGKFTGSFYFFTGVTLSAYLFDRNAATLGICQLALADPSASYFGRATRHVYWSRIENGLGGLGRNKGVLGFLGGALFCFPFNYRVLSLATYGNVGANLLPGGRNAVATAALALGFAGALADLAVPTPAVVLPKKILGVRVPPLHLDDNFVVPVFSAWACQHVFRTLQWQLDLVKLAPLLLLRTEKGGHLSSAAALDADIPSLDTA